MCGIFPLGISGLPASRLGQEDFGNAEIAKMHSLIDGWSEVFLVGNIASFAKFWFHAAEAVTGLCLTIGTLGIAPYCLKNVRDLTRAGLQLPIDFCKSIPGFGNVVAARENEQIYKNIFKERYKNKTIEELNDLIDEIRGRETLSPEDGLTNTQRESIERRCDLVERTETQEIQLQNENTAYEKRRLIGKDYLSDITIVFQTTASFYRIVSDIKRFSNKPKLIEINIADLEYTLIQLDERVMALETSISPWIPLRTELPLSQVKTASLGKMSLEARFKSCGDKIRCCEDRIKKLKSLLSKQDKLNLCEAGEENEECVDITDLEPIFLEEDLMREPVQSHVEQAKLKGWKLEIEACAELIAEKTDVSELFEDCWGYAFDSDLEPDDQFDTLMFSLKLQQLKLNGNYASISNKELIENYIKILKLDKEWMSGKMLGRMFGWTAVPNVDRRQIHFMQFAKKVLENNIVLRIKAFLVEDLANFQNELPTGEKMGRVVSKEIDRRKKAHPSG